MKLSRWYQLAAIALTLSMGGTAIAKHVAVDPESLPKVSCSDLKFSPAFLDKYPKAPAACQEGRVYKGKRYAKFQGKLFLIDKDAVTVTFLNISGSPLFSFTFKPSPTAHVKVDGEEKKYTQMRKDDVITIWVPESRFAVVPYPGSTDSSPGLPPRS